ncbi:hypothetical protein Unana1_08530 [Umbelopsis nana]
MDLAARKASNLSVLRRHDPAIVDLIDQSSHAVVYSFDRFKAGWAKKGIEGTAFLLKRNTPPYYGIYILNRLSIDNYVLFLTDDLVIELQDEYIIYQTPSEDICCLWLYEAGDRERICNEMITMRDASKNAHPIATPTSTSIDVATLFGSGSTTVQKTTTQTTSGTSLSLDQLFGKATIQEQQSVSSPPVGKSVDLAALFQAANRPQKTQEASQMPLQQAAPRPQALSLDDLFSKAMRQPASAQNEMPVSNQSLALLNQLRGSPVKEPVVEQQAPPTNSAATLLNLLKGAQPNRPHPPVPAQPAQLNMHSPANKPQQVFPSPPAPIVQQQQSPPMTQQPVTVNGSSTNPLLVLLQGSNINKPHQSSIPPPQNKVISPRMHQRGSPRRSHASPKAAASKLTLLDTLMGATPAKPLPTPPMQAPMSPAQLQQQHVSPLQHQSPPPPLQQRRSISGAPPLNPQQAHELASTHALDRIKSPNVLSKPEFIQQFLNIIQSDTSFLDALYTDYVSKETSSPKVSYPTANYSPQNYGAPYQYAPMMYGNEAMNHK